MTIALGSWDVVRLVEAGRFQKVPPPKSLFLSLFVVVGEVKVRVCLRDWPSMWCSVRGGVPDCRSVGLASTILPKMGKIPMYETLSVHESLISVRKAHEGLIKVFCLKLIGPFAC